MEHISQRLSFATLADAARNANADTGPLDVRIICDDPRRSHTLRGYTARRVARELPDIIAECQTATRADGFDRRIIVDPHELDTDAALANLRRRRAAFLADQRRVHAPIIRRPAPVATSPAGVAA